MIWKRNINKLSIAVIVLKINKQKTKKTIKESLLKKILYKIKRKVIKPALRTDKKTNENIVKTINLFLHSDFLLKYFVYISTNCRIN